MSDFLDRLAARAIGGETTLAPRLPSLFEPLQRAPIMPLADAREAPPPERCEAAPAMQAVPAEALTSAAPARTSARPAAARVAPIAHVVAATSASAAASAAQYASAPPIVGERASTPAVDRPASPSVLARPATPAPLPVQPRQVRVAPDRQETARTPASNGALLPTPASVFAAPRTAPARSERTVATRAAAARTEGKADGAGEPVVHVSIGRLEVRAAPVAAAPPRRREGPQPGSLDDYLRQRGGKASP